MDTFMVSKDPYGCFKSQHQFQNPCLRSLLSSLIYPHFELDIEWDTIYKPLLLNKKTKKLNDFAL